MIVCTMPGCQTTAGCQCKATAPVAVAGERAIEVGAIIEWKCPRFDNVHRWRVVGVHLGGVPRNGRPTESLIEVESTTHEPGWTGEWEFHPRLWIPEVLVRHLPMIIGEDA